MKQTRRMSLGETCASTGIGYFVAVVTQVVVFPIFNIHASTAAHLEISVIFTVVSILRGYAIRRLFESLRK
jgi:hypothetical protein